MDLKILERRDNPLLSRVEIKAEASFSNEATPKKEDIKKKISSMEKSDEKLVIVKNVYGDFGVGKANILAYVYKSAKELENIEPKKKEVKPTEEKKEETTEEEAKEAPKEEVKEKPKEEAKKE